MEDETEAEPLAGADHGHAVPDRRRGPAPPGFHRAVAGGEHQAVTVRDERGRGPGLGPGPLLVEQELPARVIDARLAEVDHDLQREHQVAVQVAVQGVPVPGPVAQQDRRGLDLPGGVAGRQPVVQAVRPRRRAAEPLPPVAGDRQQLRVQGLLQAGDGLGERLGEVAVLSLTEAVPGHADGGPEPRVVGVEGGDPGRLLGGEQRPGQAAAVAVEVGADRGPVGGVDPVLPGHQARAGHAATSSRVSRVRLASGPPR